MALLSPRFLGTPAAHFKCEALLAWLPDRLDQIDSLDVLPISVLHDVYKHCSYADLPERHRIKASINRLIERKLDSLGLHHLPLGRGASITGTILNRCDLFLSPFPFGNTNGIIDALTVGLPGVCKTGPQVFEHIDEGLFRRVGLPEWTIAQTPEDYIQAAVRLATDYEARVVLYQHLATSDPLGTLFSGRAHALSEALLHELR